MPDTDATLPADTGNAALPTPTLGETIHVQVAAGVLLVNNDTGQYFAPMTPTPQLVTVTTLRRLADGDFVRVA